MSGYDLRFSSKSIHMNGPENADQAQLEMLRNIRMASPNEEPEFVEGQDRSEDGEMSWENVRAVFSNEALMEADTRDLDSEDTVDGEFKALDHVYDAIKTTYHGNKKLEGLRTFRIGWDSPVGDESFKKWKQDYRDAGLISGDELTDEGEYFLDNDPRAYDFDVIDNQKVGQAFREFSTQGYGDSEPHSGKKIEAFFLYGTGLGHAEVAEQVGMAESTLRDTVERLERDEGLGLLQVERDHKNPDTAEYSFTDDGQEFGRMMLDHAQALRDFTTERFNSDYEAPEEVNPEYFDGNRVMAENLKLQRT